MMAPSLETVLTWAFAAAALAGGLVMLAARHPMRVALALIATMLSLAALYAILGVHVIAVFQVLIYVGAVMVFMVFVIMLLDTRDPAFLERNSRLLLPGVVAAAALAAVLGAAFVGLQPGTGVAPAADWRLQPFSAEFLRDHWLLFELTSVLLVAAVVAAISVLRTGEDADGQD
jgi:NADH-quinone oxidoreductase subunit J